MKNCINRLLGSGRSFALFRRPDAGEVELIMQKEGDATVLNHNTKEPSGFIISPFYEDTQRPTLLIHPDVWVKGWKQICQLTEKEMPAERIALNNLRIKTDGTEAPSESSRYEKRFTSAMRQIADGKADKIVLCYCQESKTEALRTKEADVFIKALEAYPHSFVHIFYTPQSGCWMGCSPELLLYRKGNDWKTMALAGTQTQEDGEWDTKNMQEQEIVKRYIGDMLNTLGAKQKESKTYTATVGKLCHLRTDFSFCLQQDIDTLEVARVLHPTPAVCGIPKETTMQFLLNNEGIYRNYYSGYIGPMNMAGETALYVNLRCAQIRRNETLYYAGGGITKLSVQEKECTELERKLSTLKDIRRHV